MRLSYLILFVFAFLFFSCRSTRVVTNWKAQNVTNRQYDTLLVVGIIKENGTALRMQAESLFVKELQKIGYKAVSAVETYGASGLAGMSQEDTYIKLRNKGIGAVFTFTLIDKEKERAEGMDKTEEYSTPYYYKRVWHYINMRADVTDSVSLKNHYKDFYWETILFELNALETHYMAQSKSLKSPSVGNYLNSYAREVIRNMRKNGILKLQEKVLEKEVETPGKTF